MASSKVGVKVLLGVDTELQSPQELLALADDWDKNRLALDASIEAPGLPRICGIPAKGLFAVGAVRLVVGLYHSATNAKERRFCLLPDIFI